MNAIKNIIQIFINKPRKLFLIDGIGAFMTTLAMVMACLYLSSYFGLSPTIFRLLAILAACLCLYSVSCFLWVKKKWSTFISIIAVANMLYGITSIAFAIIYYRQIQIVGVIYLSLETMIISVLVNIELRVAKNMKSRS